METPDEIERIRQFLKRNFEGEEVKEALRKRIRIHLEDPTKDPLSAQVWTAYQKLPEILEEPFSILDAGCMSGFLYHHLKRHKKDFEYTGIDRWEEALEVAREYAPGVKFLKADLLTFNEGMYDYVWCSNIPWKANEWELAAKNLARLARRAVIFAYPNQPMEVAWR